MDPESDIVIKFFMFVGWLTYAWPAFVALMFLCIRRARIKRKLGFLLVGAGSAYATMFVAIWGVGRALVFFLPYLGGVSAWVLTLSSLASFAIVWFLSLCSVLVASRFFQSNGREPLKSATS